MITFNEFLLFLVFSLQNIKKCQVQVTCNDQLKVLWHKDMCTTPNVYMLTITNILLVLDNPNIKFSSLQCSKVQVRVMK